MAFASVALCAQVLRVFTRHFWDQKSRFPLKLYSIDAEAFRANLQAHVTTMAPLGFNVHALRLLAGRDVTSLMGPPEALQARMRELRAFFHPWGDELAHGLAHTGITHACLPAVAQDQQPGLSARLATGQAAVSQLHKAVLAGPQGWSWATLEQLEAHMADACGVGPLRH